MHDALTAVDRDREPDHAHVQPGRAPALPTEPTNEPVVYVVDDDPSICRALARLFRTVGLSAETFP